VALRLARDGFKVVLNYAGHAENAEAAVAEIKAGDGHAFTVRADVADAAEVERLFQETLGTFGRIDVVVNCAGVMPMGPIADASLEAFDRVIATNLRGSFIVLAQAEDQLVQRVVSEPGGVVAIEIARGQAKDPLSDQVQDRVRDLPRLPRIRQAPGHGVRQVQPFVHGLEQHQPAVRAGVGHVESRHDRWPKTLASEGQLGYTVCSHRASSYSGVEASRHRFYSTDEGPGGSCLSSFVNKSG
jgi:hypothetical protein